MGGEGQREGEYASLALGRMDAPGFKKGPGWAMAHQFMHVKQAVELQKYHPECTKTRLSEVKNPSPDPSRSGGGHPLPTPHPRHRFAQCSAFDASILERRRTLHTALTCHTNQKIVPASLFPFHNFQSSRTLDQLTVTTFGMPLVPTLLNKMGCC